MEWIHKQRKKSQKHKNEEKDGKKEDTIIIVGDYSVKAKPYEWNITCNIIKEY